MSTMTKNNEIPTFGTIGEAIAAGKGDASYICTLRFSAAAAAPNGPSRNAFLQAAAGERKASFMVGLKNIDPYSNGDDEPGAHEAFGADLYALR